MKVLSDVEAHKVAVGEASAQNEAQHAKAVAALQKAVRDLEGELRASREVRRALRGRASGEPRGEARVERASFGQAAR
jgi:hypothetical protein